MQERDAGTAAIRTCSAESSPGKGPRQPLPLISEPARRPRLPDKQNCTPFAARCQGDYQPTYDLDHNHMGTMDMSGEPSLPANGCGPAGANHE